MIVKFSRAQRRHHNVRMYKRALRKIRGWSPDDNRLEWRAKRMFNNMKNCSCEMCCNIRRSSWADNLLSIQEIKAEDSATDSWEEYYEKT